MRLQTKHERLRPSDRSKVDNRPKQAKPFYRSPEWRALMRDIIAERGRRCEDPSHNPEQPRSGVRLYGDHVHELSDGGALLDKHNIMLRCAHCHGRKTIRARQERFGLSLFER